MAANNLEGLFDQLTLLESQKGKEHLIYQNFEFKLDRIAKTINKYNWRCNTVGCTARVYTFGLDPPVYVVKDEHNHPARPSIIEVKQAICEMKSSQASNSNLHKPRRLILEAQKQLSKEAIALMPSYEALRQRLQ